jgi:hypothetical protein
VRQAPRHNASRRRAEAAGLGPDPTVPATTVTPGNTGGADEEKDHVDEDSMHSFPASDPPGWITMWAGTPTTNEGQREEVV